MSSIDRDDEDETIEPIGETTCDWCYAPMPDYGADHQWCCTEHKELWDARKKAMKAERERKS